MVIDGLSAAVLISFCSSVCGALYAPHTDEQKRNGKYHAAAGEKAIEETLVYVVSIDACGDTIAQVRFIVC
jgi:hypothetical protein